MEDICFLFYRIAPKIEFSSLTNYRKSYITRVTYVTVISDIYSDLTLSNTCIHRHIAYLHVINTMAKV